MLPAQKYLIELILADAVAEVAKAFPIAGNTAFIPPLISLKRPKISAHGDIASNLAMQLAKSLGTNPLVLAQQLAKATLTHSLAPGFISSAEVAGAGFLNLRLTDAAKQKTVHAVLEKRERFGFAPPRCRGHGQRVLIEFVSANPTGPLHVGHGRQAALGDAIGRLMQTQGWIVHREFYYNDAGAQINALAVSVQARARGYKPGDTQWPEAAYNGDYIADIARDYIARKTVLASDGSPVSGAGDVGNLGEIQRFAVTYLRHEQDIDLKAFGIEFDQYYLESSLYDEGRVKRAIQALVTAGKTYEDDGALWLRTMDYGDDKNRVMRKKDGTYTYFVPDIVYHVTKWERGFTKAINVQGSDHHGTISRVRAGLQALDIGIPSGYPEYILHKMVTVMRNGHEIRLSKRAGGYVTIRDLIAWSSGSNPNQFSSALSANQLDGNLLRRGRDAVRFFLISRKADTEFTFDINLAMQQNEENPVYYIQYAHARICSILTELRSRYTGDPEDWSQVSLTPLSTQRSKALLQKLSEYPQMLEYATNELAPHMVAFYLRDLAGEFHAFYNARTERVLVDDACERMARAALLSATRQVLANGLATIGVSAPTKM
ncbi:arginine--tRNA ligase [Candidatus Vallotia tarda]|uniref:Arginine--tRNA ligase n=1 Tax=Candidatus Vallotiella hemipterorum TaxID=1177213 RepID=A0A916JRD9_9BURK|nr:arginine--tRNA ligase [Candidatus Vallotia tarda]CAG7595926.1 Arginine--tRNA ligase [Candidatus Vallotia tarda]